MSREMTLHGDCFPPEGLAIDEFDLSVVADREPGVLKLAVRIQDGGEVRFFECWRCALRLTFSAGSNAVSIMCGSFTTRRP